MGLIAVLLFGFLFQGCATKPNVQINCEQQGGSQYYHCEPCKWYHGDCGRFR